MLESPAMLDRGGGGGEVLRQAMDLALRLLAVGPRSEKEMRDRLLRKGVIEEDAARTIERLKELGLLNDGVFARDLVERRRRNGQGDHRIRQEMRRRGVPEEAAGNALAADFSADVDRRAWAALQRRAGRVRGLDREKASRRLYGFLGRQGFGAEETRRALRRFFSEQFKEGGSIDEEHL